jgi:integrase
MIDTPAHAGPRLDELVAELAVLFAPCEGAYSPRTFKGYAADLRAFVSWCWANQCNWLPALPHDIAKFIDHESEHHRLSTLKHRVQAIAFVHRIRELGLPTAHMAVRLALRRAARRQLSRPRQVRGLTNAIRAQLVATCPSTLAGFRDAAIISVGYDTLCRGGELAVMCLADIAFGPDDAAMVTIPRTKTDISGEGRIAYLSPETTSLLRRWLDAAHVQSGPLFRNLHRDRCGDELLHASSIRRLIKRAIVRAGLDASAAKEFSGHSMRIGAAQDMLVAGYGALAIMQAGGWKSADVVLRYVEKAAALELHARRWTSLAEALAQDVDRHMRPPAGPDLVVPRPYMKKLRLP